MRDPTSLLQTYKVEELERIAQAQIKEFGGQFTVPVDIDYLIETLPGVQLDYYPALMANHQILGMVCREADTNRYLIFIDEGLADSESQRARYRMTVAEEYAHLLIHRPAIETVQGIEDFRALQKFRKWYECERNAKRLAAMILMPSQYVLDDCRNLYPKMIAVTGFSNSTAVKNSIPSCLADRYGVSVQTMQIRLNEWPIKVFDKIDRSMKDGLNYLE